MIATLAPTPEATTAPAAPTAGRAPFAWAPVLAVVAGKVLLNLVAAGRYGWHRDELYYADAGQHLAPGYIDFPPVTPLLARLAEEVFGSSSLVGLRFLAVLAGVGVLIVAALLARDFGGGRWAQAVAALAVAPLTLGSNAMFQTVSFDQLAWALVLLAAVRLLKRGAERHAGWVPFGLAAGAALLTKYTALVLVAALGVGLLASPVGRRRLAGRGPWVAALIAGVMVAPNLWWQVRHGWPSVDFITGKDGQGADGQGPVQFLIELLVVAGPTGLLLWTRGAFGLLADRRWRTLGVTVALVVGAFLVLGGKGYYAVAVLVVAFAAGAAAFERASTGARRATVVALIAGPLLFSPVILPVLPEKQMVALGLDGIREDYAEQVGWPELAATMAGAWDVLPAAERADTALLARNYGEAGAVDRFGFGRGLPPAASHHLNHRYWGPSDDALDATVLLTVGYDRASLNPYCSELDRVATIGNDADVDNEEAGGPVFRCRLAGSLGDVWPEISGR